MLLSNNGSFPLAIRLGRWLSSVNIQPDSQLSLEETLCIDWASYPLSKILDVMEVVWDIRYNLSDRIINLKTLEFSKVLWEILYYQNDDIIIKWNKSFGTIFRHSSVQDLRKNLRNIPDGMSRSTDYFHKIFTLFPYFSIAKALTEEIPFIENTFLNTSLHRRIFDLVKEETISWSQLNDSCFKFEERQLLYFAKLDHAKATSNITDDIRRRSLEYLLKDYLTKVNIMSKSFLSWLEPFLPKILSFQLINEMLPYFSRCIFSFSLNSQISTIILELLKSSLEELSSRNTSLDFNVNEVATFFHSCVQPKITLGQAKLPAQVLGKFYSLMSKY